MPTLHKFKLLATQCAVSGSPARSPTTSPVVHLRRRKTLRMLLSRSSGATPERRRFSRREDHDHGRSVSPESKGGGGSGSGNKKEVKSRGKLKELFVSSPPPLDERERESDNSRRVDDLVPITRQGGGDGLAAGRRGGGGSDRPITSTFRYRLLMRRAWRPILVAIPE